MTRAEAVAAVERACLHQFLHMRQWQHGGAPTNRGISTAAVRLHRSMLEASA